MSDDLNNLTDTELALRAQRGDASAFEAIYDRHAEGVARALATFAGPDRDLLDDLTQDVFFRVIKGLASFTPSHPFPHWLYTITLNVGRNHARRQNNVIPVDPTKLDDIPQTRTLESDWSEDIIARTLTDLASRLPVEMRDVISLRTGSQMSYGEIAEVLGIPEGTAKSRMFNAVKMLRAKLKLDNPKRSLNNE